MNCLWCGEETHTDAHHGQFSACVQALKERVHRLREGQPEWDPAPHARRAREEALEEAARVAAHAAARWAKQPARRAEAAAAAAVARAIRARADAAALPDPSKENTAP